MSSLSIGENQASGNINGDSSDVRSKHRLITEQHRVNPVSLSLEKASQYNLTMTLYEYVARYHTPHRRNSVCIFIVVLILDATILLKLYTALR
jgi:hypothetical protein